jgi:hypothetical protein
VPYPIDDPVVREALREEPPLQRAQAQAVLRVRDSPRFYANARGGPGILVYRQTPEADETKVLPSGDINGGFRF